MMNKWTFQIFVWTLLLATTTACTLSAPEQVVVVTSDAPPEVRTQIAQDLLQQTQVALTPSPLPVTDTPTPEPTATIEPAVLLRQGDRLRLNGYYERAVYAYGLVVEAATGNERAEALFRQGQSAVKEGLFAEAVPPLSQLIAEFPQDTRVSQAHFLRGDAYLGQSMWADAIQDFETYLSLRTGLVDSYVYERMGDAQLALGLRDAAVQNYTLAVQSSRSVVPLLALRERLAQIYLGGGQVLEAIAQYDAILQTAENDAYRAQIEYAAALAYLQGGLNDEAIARLQRVIETYPTQVQAYNALTNLDTLGATVNDYTRGQVAYAYGDYAQAVDAFNRYTTQVPLINVPPNMYLLLGRSYREMGNPAAATVAFRTVIDQYPQSPEFGDALLEQARTLFLAGQELDAIQQYLSIAETYGYLTETAAEALWRAGYLYGTNDEPILSAQTFERLANAYPNTTQAQSGLFIGASAAYSAGDYTTAERLYARLTVITTGDDQATAYFWLGQIARQQGDEATATRAFQSALAAAPDSYFAARSQDIVTGIAPFQSPAQYDFNGDTAEDIQAAEDWIRARVAIEQTGALWPLPDALRTDPRIVRGEELWQLAAYAEAEIEFFDIVNEMGNQRNILASYQLAVHLRSMGAYYPSIFAAANVIRSANETTLSAPRFIARMRYPVYYLDAMQEVAPRYGLDPLLMFSLIRHESLFNTNATAAAGEKGLTQVIPSTADYIANQISWPDYQHGQLFKPHVGIEFGAYYLQEQLQLFDGNVTAALAAYNAGPGRAIDWLQLSGGDPDLFMTTITIDSTRLYVQLIYRNYAIYRALYGV